MRTIIWISFSVLAVLAASLLPSPHRSTAALLIEFVRGCDGYSNRIASGEPLVIGHRGAAGYAVENTLASMDTALARGANALEIDLCMTADGAIVLWHDWEPDSPIAEARVRGAEPDVLARPKFPDESHPLYRLVHRLTLAQLRSHYGYESRDDHGGRIPAQIPTLQEFIAWAAAGRTLRAVFLDIKVPASAAPLASPMIRSVEQLLAAAPKHIEWVYLVADSVAYDSVESALVHGRISFDAEPPAGLVLDPCSTGSVTRALRNGNHYASIIVPYSSTMFPWTTARRIIECEIAKADAAGDMRVLAGTVNDPEKLECLISQGIDGIITDYPDRIRTVMATVRSRRSTRR